MSILQPTPATVAGQFVAYYRVSTARQGRSGLGLDAQREAQAKFIDVQRGRLNPLYAVTYLAGKIAHRLVSKQAEKAYQKLLDEALLNPEVAAALLKAENPANRAALARAAKGWQVYEAAGLTELLSQLGDEPAPEDDDPVISAVMKGAK